MTKSKTDTSNNNTTLNHFVLNSVHSNCKLLIFRNYIIVIKIWFLPYTANGFQRIRTFNDIRVDQFVSFKKKGHNKITQNLSDTVNSTIELTVFI